MPQQRDLKILCSLVETDALLSADHHGKTGVEYVALVADRFLHSSSPGSSTLGLGLRAESVTNTGPNNTFVELDRDVGNQGGPIGIYDGAIRRARAIGKIDKKVFDLRGPIASKRTFDAGADRPAPLGGVACGMRGVARRDISQGRAGGAIDEVAIESITHPAAQRSQPVVRGYATAHAYGRFGNSAAAKQVSPGAVALNAEND